MTDTTLPKAPLGVGAIIGETFRVWLANIVPIFLATLIPQVIIIAITLAVFGVDAYVMQPSPEEMGAYWVSTGVRSVLGLMGAALGTAMIVRIAYDASSGRPVNLGAAIGGAFRHILPLAVLYLVVSIVGGLGFVLLIVPGLYIYAMWSVTAPAIVVENAGFGGLRRSSALTKGYRWPIIGTGILVFLILIIPGILIGLLTVWTVASAGLLVAIILQVLLSALLSGPVYVVIVMIYTRLREIKEGIAVEDLARVFD